MTMPNFAPKGIRFFPLEPWQNFDIDYPWEFDVSEFVFINKILSVDGLIDMDVYKKFKERMK